MNDYIVWLYIISYIVIGVLVSIVHGKRDGYKDYWNDDTLAPALVTFVWPFIVLIILIYEFNSFIVRISNNK